MNQMSEPAVPLVLSRIPIATISQHYPCGNFSDTSYQKPSGLKGSIGHAFAVCTRTESQDQASFCPYEGFPSSLR
ncbi:unnamed protein product [Heligmosomoides polygyrus]|uniref:Uncharacterized protein n=1 Tax=Heligmosomoides polygyrus TaxID=6339 RepID=A0A183FHI0_HELPZ|nr:unnamed protein product [Heligmosomoides polygyrus]